MKPQAVLLAGLAGCLLLVAVLLLFMLGVTGGLLGEQIGWWELGWVSDPNDPEVC